MRETVCDIDRDILKLVMRRYNLIQRMAATKGKLAPQEERYIRESWEAQVAKVSSDPKLSSRFFTLLQEVNFAPRPEEGAAPRRPSFGLAPLQKPVNIALDAPRDQEETQVWCAMAAASGQPVSLTQVLMNDAVTDCVHMFNQFSCALKRTEGKISADATAPAQAPDKIIHVGNSPLNFYMSVAHYIGRPSHAKFSGGPALKLADFSALRRFLPTVGARMISLVPRSDGLPMRIESAGLVPDVIPVAADLPADFVLSLVMAAPFYQKPVIFDFAAYPKALADDVLRRAMPILKQAGCDCERQETTLALRAGQVSVPAAPDLAMDLSIATVLFALGAINGGKVQLSGQLADNARTGAVQEFFAQLNLSLKQDENGVTLRTPAGYKLPDTRLTIPAALPATMVPLVCACACVQALRYGQAQVPDGCQHMPETLSDLNSFAGACGLLLNEDVLEPRHDDGEEHGTPAWTAPSSMWACALALTACARPHAGRGFQLNNPGVLTDLYPGFWALYNALPEPKKLRAEENGQIPQPRERRRIRTSQVAQLTPRPEEDF